MTQSRQLAAVMFTDIVGYTALMEQDEKKAFEVLKKNLAIHQSVINKFHGRLIKELGDGILASFSTVSDALEAAIEIQKQVNATSEFKLSIGIHQGEVVFENGDIFGDAVNVASRIQSLGTPGSIIFSGKIADEIKNKSEFTTASLGRFEFKNVKEPIEVFALANDGFPVPIRNRMQGKLKKHSNKRYLRFGVLTILAVALVLTLFYLFTTTQPEPDKSIAVLPFNDFSQAHDQEYFCDGMMEEILNHLAKVGDLQVISRTSSMKYKGSKISLSEIARELGVTNILEGSIRKSGEQIRITVQLIDAKTDKHIWSQDYDYRDMKDIFAVQTDVSEHVVKALKAKLTPQEKGSLSKKYTDNLEAYKFYLKGRFLWDKRSRESYDSAEVYYKRAIELDPEYALAYSGLADLYTFNLKGLLQTDAVPIAKEYVAKALELDSSLSQAWTTKGFIQSHYDYDWKGSIPIFERAMQLNPNYPIAHLYLGNVYFATGDVERGIQETKKALELDPLSSSINFVLGRNYYFARQYDLAIKQLEKTITIDPTYIYAKMYLALALAGNKSFPKAIDILSKMPAKRLGTEYPPIILIYVYSLMDDKTKAKTELKNEIGKEEFKREFLSPLFLAATYVNLGDNNEAILLLERGYHERIIHMMHVKVNPYLDPLQNDPRFQDLLKRLHFD